MSEIPDDATVTCNAGTAPQVIAKVARVGLSAHILPTAATLVGACMTVLSIGRLTHSGRLGFFIDKMLAFDSVVFSRQRRALVRGHPHRS